MKQATIVFESYSAENKKKSSAGWLVSTESCTN